MTAAPLMVRWYGIVAAIAALAAAKAIAMPRWPATPDPLPQRELEARLRDQGLSPSSGPAPTTAGWPAERGYELSTSAPVIITLRDGFELIMMAASVRQRFSLQTAYIGRDQPSLKLKNRRLINRPVPSASGLVQDQPTLQTCLVRGPGQTAGFGVTRVQLSPLTDQGATRWVRLERLVGLRPHRSYGCTLISLRGPKGTPPSQPLWGKVLQTLEPVLRSPV